MTRKGQNPAAATNWTWTLQWGRGTNDAESVTNPTATGWGATWLQWGRVTNDAESMYEIVASEVQWGRVTNDTESPQRKMIAQQIFCFNGDPTWGATRRCGKVCRDLPIDRARVVSMGPRHE
jgi:hypothetical protein